MASVPPRPQRPTRVKATINSHHLPMLCRLNPDTGQWEQVLPTTHGRAITVPLNGLPPAWATILHAVPMPWWRRGLLAVVRFPAKVARAIVPRR